MALRTSILGCVVLAAIATAACAPTTQYRYSAVTPSAQPIAWDGVTEREGFARFEGTISGEGVTQNEFPQIHSTALQVPQWTVQGAAMLALAKVVELGVRGSYSAYQWTTPSSVGTMPVPDAPPTWGVGPELRLSIPVDKDRRFKFGMVANVLVQSVPYAQWTLTGSQASPPTPSCVPSATCVATNTIVTANYSLANTQTETHFVWTLGLVPSYAFGAEGAYGHVFAGLTATTGFENDGFTNTPQTGSTVNTFWPLFIVSAGYAVPIDAVRLSGTFFKPITDPSSPVNYSVGFMLTLGVAAELWEPHHHGVVAPDPAPAAPTPEPQAAPPAPENPTPLAPRLVNGSGGT